MVASWTLGHLADIIPSPAWFDSGLCGLCRNWAGGNQGISLWTHFSPFCWTVNTLVYSAYQFHTGFSCSLPLWNRSPHVQLSYKHAITSGQKLALSPYLKLAFSAEALPLPTTSQFPWWLVCTDVIYLLWRKNLPWSLLTSWWRFPFRKKGVNPPLPFVSSLLYQIKAGNSKLPFQLLSSNLGRKLDFYSWLLSHAPHGSLALSWKHLIFPTIPWLLLWLFWDFSWDLF